MKKKKFNKKYLFWGLGIVGLIIVILLIFLLVPSNNIKDLSCEELYTSFSNYDTSKQVVFIGNANIKNDIETMSKLEGYTDFEIRNELIKRGESCTNDNHEYSLEINEIPCENLLILYKPDYDYNSVTYAVYIQNSILPGDEIQNYIFKATNNEVLFELNRRCGGL